MITSYKGKEIQETLIYAKKIGMSLHGACKDLVFFTEKITGSTFAIEKKEFTIENLKDSASRFFINWFGTDSMMAW
jgi:hypothetical protein